MGRVLCGEIGNGSAARLTVAPVLLAISRYERCDRLSRPAATGLLATRRSPVIRAQHRGFHAPCFARDALEHLAPPEDSSRHGFVLRLKIAR